MMILSKATLCTAGLVSILGLSACQSPQQHTKNTAKAHSMTKSERHFKAERQHGFKADKHHKQMRGHHLRGTRHAALTEEQKAQFEQLRSERKAHAEVLQKNCESKIGQTISITIGDKTLNGTCRVYFQPERQKISKPSIQPTTKADTSS